MEHAQAVALYDDYFKGKLDRETTRAFHAHLNGCEDCKVRLRTTRASLSGSSMLRSSPGGEDRMKEILRRNRTMTYVVIVIMLCFFFFFRLKR